MVIRFRRWIKYLVAVIVGNILYFESAPLLPPAARHHSLVDWGTFVDLWFCLFVYGVIELVSFLARKLHNQ
ncbi:MAG TPA: hypothetical protein VGY31_14825 [Terriglobia bacterium]|nr:hypothetical protein [Terriglobia bacterium]